MIYVRRNVLYTQAKGTYFCLHVGSAALFFGIRLDGKTGPRLELFTDKHRFRWTRGHA